MKKDSMIIMLVVLAVFVVLALVWQSIPAAREVTVDDYATDQHGSYLARWGVYYYEVIGTDTTLVDMDTTDSYGAYEITAPTGSYLIYAFPLWDDSTDTSLSRKSFMNEQTIVAVANDTTFLRFVKADSGFIGTVQGNIATADSAAVAHRAHTAVKFDASDSATFGGHAQHNATLNVGADGTGHDVNYYGDSTGTRLFWDASKMALRTGIAEGDEWHEDSLGMYSFSVGRNNVAAGTSSVAMGEKCDAYAPFSLAGGWRSIVKSSGDRSIAWGCESIASGYASTAFGFSDARGRYSVALGRTTIQKDFSVGMGYSTTVTGSLAVACGSGLLSQGDFSAGLGYRSSALGDYSLTCGHYLMADSANTIVIGSGETFAKKLHNHTPNSIVLGMNSETATMTIKKDTTWIDSVLVVSDEIIGDLTGTADHAITASTCTTWTGSGTVDDSLTAHKADIVSLWTGVDANIANISVHDDTLAEHKIDIAALEATKMDTSDGLYVETAEYTFLSYSSSLPSGTDAFPILTPRDTIRVVRCWASWKASSATGAYKILVRNGVAAGTDTIGISGTLQATGWNEWTETSPTNAIVTPAQKLCVRITETVDGTTWYYAIIRVEYVYVNP